LTSSDTAYDKLSIELFLNLEDEAEDIVENVVEILELLDEIGFISVQLLEVD